MQIALRRGFGYAFNPLLGMRGLGDDTSILDPSGFTDAPTGIVTSSPTEGVNYDALIAQGVTPSDACSYDPAGCDAANALIGMGPTPITTPGAVLTPAQLAQQQASASAWLLQNVPATPAGITQAQQLATLGLTAAQIASGLTAGTVRTVPTASCSSGYQYSSGPCVPGSVMGQLIPGLSNTTLGIVAIAFVALMMMGGGGKRR